MIIFTELQQSHYENFINFRKKIKKMVIVIHYQIIAIQVQNALFKARVNFFAFKSKKIILLLIQKVINLIINL